MNLESFISGSYTQEYQYKAFLPNKVLLNWSWNDAKINLLLDEANRKLGEVNAFSYLIPNIDLFIKMHIAKEASESSRIEGTHTTVDEAIMKESDISPEKRDDWKEVHQYILAMNEAITLLEKLPISNRLIKEIHKILLTTGRGENKTPGEFRISQNWIGGRNLSDAHYVPPHQKYVEELMSDLEKFINDQDFPIAHLVKIAIIHYQFETIHPFLDGNGRLGRLLIPLYLIQNNILKKPSLYLSDYLERNRAEYYQCLTETRINNNLIRWIQFFLKAVISTAENTKNTFLQIIDLQKEMHSIIAQFGSKAENISTIIEHFYETPIMSIKEITEKTGISDKTTRNLISTLEKEFILSEVTGNERNKLYRFNKYLNLFEKK